MQKKSNNRANTDTKWSEKKFLPVSDVVGYMYNVIWESLKETENECTIEKVDEGEKCERKAIRVLWPVLLGWIRS